MLSLPGLAVAYATNSGIDLIGSDGCTTTTLGKRMMPDDRLHLAHAPSTAP